MPTNQRHAVMVECFQTATHDLRQDRRIDAGFWETRNRHRRDRCSGHRPNVVDRIERTDAAEVERVVDNRRKKVERLHQSEVVAETVYSRVVGGVETDNQVWVVRL